MQRYKILCKMMGSLLELLYPPQCHMCGKSLLSVSNSFVCPQCMEQVVFLGTPLCVICGRPHIHTSIVEDHYCGDCLKKRPVFTSARAVVAYQQPAAGLLHRLKYNADTSVSGPLREIIATGEKTESMQHCHFIVPVPLYPSRLKNRGLNQSLVLAKLMSPGGKIIVPDLLVRVKDTFPQTGLNGAERRRNLKGAFEVKKGCVVKDKKVLLVDDVYTTGTTVSECAETLMKKGCSEVHVWTFARV